MERAECRICGKKKAFGEFDKLIKEGPYEVWNLRCCKQCTHAAYVQRYGQRPKREKQKAASRNWKKDNPERHAALNQEYRMRYPERVIAQNRLGYAVRSGKLTRLPCEVCGATKKVHGHHVSYEPKDWYNVRWLCFQCHKTEHEPAEYLRKK